ncbi:hypothetical protein HMPREF0791_0220, partial [Staphylococcus epidermidis W23144]
DREARDPLHFIVVHCRHEVLQALAARFHQVFIFHWGYLPLRISLKMDFTSFFRSPMSSEINRLICFCSMIWSWHSFDDVS